MRTQATDYPSCPLLKQPPLKGSLGESLWAFFAALLLHGLLCLALAVSWNPAEFAAFSSGGGGGGGFWLHLGAEGIPGIEGAGQNPSGKRSAPTGENSHAQLLSAQARAAAMAENPPAREEPQASPMREAVSERNLLLRKMARRDQKQKESQRPTMPKKPVKRAEKKGSEKTLPEASPALPGNGVSSRFAGAEPGGGGGGSSLGHGKGWGDGEGEGIGPGRGSGSGGGTGSGHGTGTGAGMGPGMGIHDAAFGGSSGPSFLRYSPPDYPASARRRKESGVVLLEVWINADGRATRVDVVSGVSGALDKAAADSVKRARFVPYRKGGQPKDCRTRIPVRFRLR